MYSLAQFYNLTLKITLLSNLSILRILIHALEKAKETISMYDILNNQNLQFSSVHVYNLMPKITFKSFYTWYIVIHESKKLGTQLILNTQQ